MRATSLATDEKKSENCSFCGNVFPYKELGMWKLANKNMIFCCRDCSIGILPKFLADSLAYCDIDWNSDKMRSVFWRAAYYRGD